MASIARSRHWIVWAMVATAALRLSACAGSVDLPSSDDSSSTRATPAAPATAAERSAADSEYPPISVDADEPERGANDEANDAGEPEREGARPRPPLLVIDPYPPNPRCYAGGQYVPAPPLCPSL